MQSRNLLSKHAVLFDLGAIFLAASLSFIARLGLSLTLTHYIRPATTFILLSLVLKPSLLSVVGIYRVYWGHVSWREVRLLLLSATAGSLGLLVGDTLLSGWLFQTGPGVPRSVFAIDWLATVLALGFIRESIHASLQPNQTKSTTVRQSHYQFNPEGGLTPSEGDRP